MQYKTSGTCSQLIDLEVEGDVIRSVAFTGGCNGNLKGISALVSGKDKFFEYTIYMKKKSEALRYETHCLYRRRLRRPCDSKHCPFSQAEEHGL